MNERIKELVDKIWAEEYWTNPNTDKLLPAQLNKFAELIVRECADICTARKLTPAAFVASELREYFGVIGD